MGTTSEKLTYLNTTKQKLKQAINNLGGDITNETTFRNYATELDTLYSNLPKVEGEGSSITLSPTLKGKLNYENNIVGYGDTEQTQYSGYNILENKMANSVSRGGITYTKREDGSVLVNGTATSLSYCVLTNTAGNINDYTTALFTMGSSFYCTPQNDINSVTMQYRLTNGDYKNYSNLASNDVIGLAYLQVNSGVTINNLVVYPMIVNGSSAVKPYEPYVGGTASPKPSYPQDIEVVTGTQNVKVSNTNKLPYANEETQTSYTVTHKSNGDGTYIINGTATNGNSGANLMFSNISYTIQSGDYLFLGNTSTNGQIALGLMENVSTQITSKGTGQLNATLSLESYVGRTITGVKTYLANGNTANNFELKPMIVHGNTAPSEFTPHQEQTQLVELSSKNKFDNVLYNGQVLGDGTLNTSILTRITNVQTATSSRTYLEKGTYTISAENLDYTTLMTKNASGTILDNFSSEWHTLPYTFTLTQNGYLYFSLRKSDNSNLTPSNFNVQVEKGNSATSFEEYYNYELCKIGNYQDYFYKTSGKNLANESQIQIGKSWNNTSNTSRATILFIPLESGVTYSFASAYTNSHITSIRAVLNYGIDNDNRNLVVNTTSFSTDTYTHVSLEILADTTFTQSMLEGTKIFLCKGEGTIANYEPYGSGNWYKKENIWKTNIDTTQITLVDTYSNIDYAGILKATNFLGYNTYDEIEIKCNKATFIPYSRPSWNTSDNVGKISGNANLIRWWLGFTKGTTLDNMKNALLNSYIYYPLQNANDIQITNTTLIEQLDNIENLMSYSGQTSIEVVGDLPMIIKARALKGE